ncbi:MAG: glycosyltransferase [Phycisphaeraceae bacterium]|nr:glycosyltransferase [Phycisphaeraceae bacterium]
MMLVALLWIGLSIAAGALAMTIWNLALYCRPRADAPARAEMVTVCIPARNEERNLEVCVRAVLAQDHDALRVLVYDDGSTDGTADILDRLCRENVRVEACPVHPHPPGWVGKQFACDQMGLHAGGEYLLFIDADVRLAPDCIRRALDSAHQLRADLLSTFPRQVTGSIGEQLLVPMIHFILFSYLPFVRMRRTNDPAASAACGQFVLVQREAYLAAGGHASVRDSMHDGVKLPRVFRRAGFRTDLFDGTDLASCRMYEGLGATWRGFAKNAYEGLGSPGLLVFLTVLHLLGHVLPWVVLAWAAAAWIGEEGGPAAASPATMAVVLAALACTLNIVQRGLLSRRFAQGLLPVGAHPLGVLMMTAVQWYSSVLQLRGARAWRGRAGPLASGARREMAQT